MEERQARLNAKRGDQDVDRLTFFGQMLANTAFDCHPSGLWQRSQLRDGGFGKPNARHRRLCSTIVLRTLSVIRLELGLIRCANIRSVRTTLDIDDDVLQAAKELAAAQKQTAGRVLSALARSALAGAADQHTPSNRNGFALLRDSRRLVTSQYVERLLDDE